MTDAHPLKRTTLQQISSIMYRWHPAVLWTKGYPKRDEILSNVRRIWEKYDLKQRTRFNVSGQKREEGLSTRKVHQLNRDVPFPLRHKSARLPVTPRLAIRTRAVTLVG